MGKQFIERNQVIIGVVSAILIAITLYFSLSVTREDLTGGYLITASFPDANGLRVGDAAVVAGIKAGTVTNLEIVGDRVEAEIEIDGSVDLPRSTRASITVRTLVGKKAIDLQTGNDFTDLLQDGDRIQTPGTVVLDVPQLAESAEDFLTEIDSEALNELLVAVSDVTRDQRDEVATLVNSGNDLTTLVNSQEQQIRLLLRNLSSLSQTLESRDDELIGVIDDLNVALSNLSARRADLQRLLRETQDTSRVNADFIARIRGDLTRILNEVHLDLEIVSRHQVDIAEGLAYVGDAVIGFSSIAFAQGQPVEWGHVFTTAAGAAGLDGLAGCGGLIDQQLDLILGPDPRTCEEQGADTFPEGTPNADDGTTLAADGPGLRLVDPVTEGVITLAPQRLGLDFGARALLAALEAER